MQLLVHTPLKHGRLLLQDGLLQTPSSLAIPVRMCPSKLMGTSPVSRISFVTVMRQSLFFVDLIDYSRLFPNFEDESSQLAEQVGVSVNRSGARLRLHKPNITHGTVQCPTSVGGNRLVLKS